MLGVSSHPKELCQSSLSSATPDRQDQSVPSWTGTYDTAQTGTYGLRVSSHPIELRQSI